MNETSRVIIVRHAERLDEVCMTYWGEVCRRHREERMVRDRCPYSEGNDPHLTEQGIKQAEEAAEHLCEVLRSAGVVLERIYSSRLIRAVQTAHKIAEKLGVPIVVSSTLAESAAAVAQSNGAFDFLSCDELAHFAPGVALLDGDLATSSPAGAAHEGEEEGAPEVAGARDDFNWEQQIHAIAKTHPTSVVVAHRETVRDLAPDFMRRKVPYCGLAYFECQNRPAGSTMKLHSCSDRDGTIIFQKRAEERGSFWP